MRRFREYWRIPIIVALILGLTIVVGPSVSGAAKKEVVIRAAVRADASGPDRALNLKRAVERL